MKELVEKIVRVLVDSPEEVHVQEISGISITLVKIRVSRQDVRYLVGKKGKNIDALRTIVSAAGKGERYMVEVHEPEKPQGWLSRGYIDGKEDHAGR